MIVLNNSYYLLLALLSIIGGIKVLLHLKKNNNYRLTVEKAAYVISYSFFIYISFSLAMYGLSYHKSLIKKEAKLVAYDKFRTNTIVYDIGDKRFTSSHKSFYNPCFYARKSIKSLNVVELQ